MRSLIIQLVITVFFTGFLTALSGQYNVDIEIENYENDTLIVGYFYGEKQLVRDTLYAQKKGHFVLSGADTLHNGAYILMTFPDKQFIQFHVNEAEKHFSLMYDYNDKANIYFEGSQDNKAFHDYISLVTQLRPKAEILRDTIRALREKERDTKQFENELRELDLRISAKQEKILVDIPESITAKIIKSNIDIEVPEFMDVENQEMAKYRYYKSHYFDNIDLADPESLYLGVLSPRVDAYLERLTAKHPDSIARSLDTLLAKMAPAPDTYRYYLSTFLNKYGQAKIVGYDAVYVHLADNYYKNGKAPWISAENLAKLTDNADKIRPTLIGNIGADLVLYGEDGQTKIKMSEMDYEYLILLFWAPDCGHCTKSLPKFVDFNERWKESGVKILAICTKHQDKTENCWKAVKEKDMLGFVNAADQYHRSKFKLHYNVSKTPKLFILDKTREIIMKDLGADQLDEVMISILKADGKEDLIPIESK